jgi:hypothetical protein
MRQPYAAKRPRQRLTIASGTADTDAPKPALQQLAANFTGLLAHRR